MPGQVATSINDMLDNCGKVKPGHHVVILSHVDGLYGGPNLVDEQAVAWLQAAVQLRGANASVVWIDETARLHAWRIPPIVKATLQSADVFINNSFDLSTEELVEFRAVISSHPVTMIRNFATTAPLLGSAWAQTPYDLVCQIRHQASLLFNGTATMSMNADGTSPPALAPSFDRP